MADEVMRATGTHFVLDGDGCTDDAVAVGGTDNSFASAFITLARSHNTYTFVDGRMPKTTVGINEGSGFNHRGAMTIFINRSDVLLRYGVTPIGLSPSGKTECAPASNSWYRLDQIIVHELGHAYAFETGQTNSDPAMQFERSYQGRSGMPMRPDACH